MPRRIPRPQLGEREESVSLALCYREPERAVHEELAAKTLSVIHVGGLSAANPVVAITRKDGYARTLLDDLAASF